MRKYSETTKPFDAKQRLHNLLTRARMYTISVEAFLTYVSLLLEFLGKTKLAVYIFDRYAANGNVVDMEFLAKPVQDDWVAEVKALIYKNAPELEVKKE